MKTRTLVSTLVLVLSLSPLMQVTSVSASPQSHTTNILKATLVGTTFLDPATNAQAPQTNFGADDINPAYDLLNKDLPGKAPQTSSSPTADPPGGSDPLTIPVAQGIGVQTTAAGLTSVKGLNAHDERTTHAFTLEPPDQALCAGNGFVVEAVNLDIRVRTTSLAPVSSVTTLESFFGVPTSAFISDPKCYFDPGTAHWFVSVLRIASPPFAPSVPGVPASVVLLAVSKTSLPTGFWNIFSINTADDGTGGTPSNPGCPCFGDQPLLGANKDAIFLSTNEFTLVGFAFNGANVYVIDKKGLVAGGPSVNVQAFFIGLTLPVPDFPAGCTASGGVFCWFSIQPATSPSVGQGSSEDHGDNQGTEFALSALQFVGLLDNRIALWAFTNTGSIKEESPDVGVSFKILKSETYGFPINNDGNTFAAQKAGPTPLGDRCKSAGCFGFPAAAFSTFSLPGSIQTNDDRMNQAVYAKGLVWAGLNTVLRVSTHGGEDTEANVVDPTLHTGIAFFAVRPSLGESGLSGKIETQGYVAVSKNNVLFPSIGVTAEGKALIAFTLTGPDFFPSSAFLRVGEDSESSKIVISAAGQSPQDGFSEYRFFGTPFFNPRWGDYTAAVALGNKIFFATEYIQSPNCSDAAWAIDTTCGGTRVRNANWGTSINVVDVGD